jgi:geranylgeranyl transferase type-2 subunit beta
LQFRDIRTVSYLTRQRNVLATQLTRALPADLVRRHTSYLTAAQRDDGGFAGREGDSDLYYTAFGLWGLHLLGALSESVGVRVAAFLRDRWQQPTHLVDFFSLLHSYRLLTEALPDTDVARSALPVEFREGNEMLWGQLVVAGLSTCRTADGGYARAPGQNNGSTYATFLTILCHDELKHPLPEPDKARTFLESRRREDGGFVEIAPMRRSGSNPTAAALASLRLLDAAPSEAAGEREAQAIAFLLGLQSVEGGFCANTRVPLADLLSTFTSLWSLYELGALARVKHPAARRYVSTLQEGDGGFQAGLWDEQADVEYTFYGLGSLALLGAD